jgi:chemotaxis regulatin CheY-phosphate phosphatase CheZ
MPEKAAEAPLPSLASREERLNANYAGIEQVLSASARGRWFLAEHARRARAADTSTLLEAIVKLELAVLRSQRSQSDRVLADLVEISEAIERTRREIAAIKPTDQLNAASTELDGVVAATEKATSEILSAAEEVQEVGWILREKGVDLGLCDVLDRRATDIYTACSFQDLTGQRTEKVVRVLRFIEERINAMIEIWGTGDVGFRMDTLLAEPPEAPDLLNGAEAQAAALMQGDVDAMLGAEAATPARREEDRIVANGAGVPRSEQPKQAPLSDLAPAARAALFG